MKNFKNLTIALLLLSSVSYAQDYTYVHSSNPISYDIGKVISFPLTIDSTNIVYISNKSTNIVKVHGPIVLTETALASMFTKKDFIVSDYFAAMLKKMAKKTYKTGHAFGGVSRGNSKSDMLTPSNSQLVLDKTIPFSWKEIKGVRLYYFHLYDSEDNLLLKIGVNGTSFDLFHQFLGLKEGSSYFWYVSGEEFYEPQEIFSFQVAKFLTKNQINSEIKRIKEQPNANLNLLAYYLESNLIKEANTLYSNIKSTMNPNDAELFKFIDN